MKTKHQMTHEDMALHQGSYLQSASVGGPEIIASADLAEKGFREPRIFFERETQSTRGSFRHTRLKLRSIGGHWFGRNRHTVEFTGWGEKRPDETHHQFGSKLGLWQQPST